VRIQIHGVTTQMTMIWIKSFITIENMNSFRFHEFITYPPSVFPTDLQIRKIASDGHTHTREGVFESFRTGRLERELQMVQLSAIRCYFVSQSSEFCRHNPLCCFLMSVYCCCCLFRYRFSPETFWWTLVHGSTFY
jgi:hypothetical protein